MRVLVYVNTNPTEKHITIHLELDKPCPHIFKHTSSPFKTELTKFNKGNYIKVAEKPNSYWIILHIPFDYNIFDIDKHPVIVEIAKKENIPSSKIEICNECFNFNIENLEVGDFVFDVEFAKNANRIPICVVIEKNENGVVIYPLLEIHKAGYPHRITFKEKNKLIPLTIINSLKKTLNLKDEQLNTLIKENFENRFNIEKESDGFY